MASRAGFWEKGLLNYSWLCTVLHCTSPVAWKNTCVYKTGTNVSTLEVDLLSRHLLFKAAFERRFWAWLWGSDRGCPSFPQHKSGRPCYPEFQGGLCQSWIGSFIFICMGRRVRLDRYLVVPLVLFQSYFGTFWKNNKMTVATQAADFSRLLYVYLNSRKYLTYYIVFIQHSKDSPLFPSLAIITTNSILIYTFLDTLIHYRHIYI